MAFVVLVLYFAKVESPNTFEHQVRLLGAFNYDYVMFMNDSKAGIQEFCAIILIIVIPHFMNCFCFQVDMVLKVHLQVLPQVLYP